MLPGSAYLKPQPPQRATDQSLAIAQRDKAPSCQPSPNQHDTERDWSLGAPEQVREQDHQRTRATGPEDRENLLAGGILPHTLVQAKGSTTEDIDKGDETDESGERSRVVK